MGPERQARPVAEQDRSGYKDRLWEREGTWCWQGLRQDGSLCEPNGRQQSKSASREGVREDSGKPKEGWAEEPAPPRGHGRKRHAKEVVGESHSGWRGIQQWTTKVTSIPRKSTLTRCCKIQTRQKPWKARASSRPAQDFN